MDILIIASLIIGAVILFLVELFVIPGISVAGFLAGGCIIFANYYAFAYMGTTAGVITLIISALACIGSLVWFMRSKTLDKIALKKNITSKVDRSAEEKVKVGDIGVTTTRLALIGYAEINGDIVEVKSSDGFLNEKTPIIVDRIADGVGISNFAWRTIFESARTVIFEINERYPRLQGVDGSHRVHLSEADYVVEGEHEPLPVRSYRAPSETDIAIARLVVNEIPDRRP